MLEEYLWSQKYRPKTIDECILPTELRETFKGYVKQGDVSDLIFAGPAGIGKTTVARALLDEIGANYILINASLEGNIDTLRNDIQKFASTVSLEGGDGRKYVILDEADYLNPNSTQPALRSFMDQFSGNCGFIMTANYEERIIEPLRSRSPVVRFDITKKDQAELAKLFYKRLKEILAIEHIEYDGPTLVELVKKHMPDWRRILNECQRYAAKGKIDSGILTSHALTSNFDKLVDFIKTKKFTEARKWVGENIDADPTTLIRNIYDSLYEHLQPATIPQAVLILADYQYKAAFVADQEINLVAMIAELMGACEFK